MGDMGDTFLLLLNGSGSHEVIAANCVASAPHSRRQIPAAVDRPLVTDHLSERRLDSTD